MKKNINTKKIFLIAEIGINHGGQFDVALDLIKASAASGVQGIKFQYRNLDNAYGDGVRQIGDEILLKEITKNYLSPLEIIKLVDHAHQLNMHAGISFFDEGPHFAMLPTIGFKRCRIVATNINNQILRSRFCQ
jgi:sialic acid synthase SpsE